MSGAHKIKTKHNRPNHNINISIMRAIRCK